jgi:aldose 1-epimerase
MHAPTGDQYELTRDTPSGFARAEITQVAAGIRTFSLGGIDLTEPFPVDATPPSGCGITLVPWPNRVANGRWSLDGVEQQLALTEPARGNAIHGLLRFTPYELVEHDGVAVTLAATVYPQAGYPFLLDTTVRHELVDDGMVVTHTVSNVGPGRAPVAVGAHPYLKIGDVDTAELILRLSASTHIEADERMNVVGEHPVEGTRFDLRGGARVADLTLDDGFGDLTITGGESTQTLTAPDGRSVALWADEHFGYLQVFTSRVLATLPKGSVAVALEPMTAPANALNSGAGLTWLEPEATMTARWGIRHRGFEPRLTAGVTDGVTEVG